MKRFAQRYLLIMVCLSVMALLLPSYSAAFEAIKLGDESELGFYGWFRNNTGMFLQNQWYAHHNNRLAVERTWFRGYMDFKITNQIRFFTGIQFVYEPEYWMEKGAMSSVTPIQFGEPIKRRGGEYSEYRNINDIVREATIEWKPDKTSTIKFGRQIAIWGEALTTRVGDVIHPDDERIGFTFANLEDTRIPSWMVRGMHDFPGLNSSIDWIVNPNLVQKKYRVHRLAMYPSGIFDAGGNLVGWTPGERFGLFPEDRDSIGGTNSAYAPTNPWTPVTEDYPGVWKGLRGGFRTNTTLSSFNFGVSYFHTQEYNPIITYGNVFLAPNILYPGAPGLTDQLHLVHPNKDIFGAYMNRQLPWPGVIRTELIYVPNQPFHSLDYVSNPRGIVRGNYVKYLVGYDLNSFLYYSWHKDASFDITFEHIGEWIPKSKTQYIIYNTENRHYNPAFNMRISTTWLYNMLATELVVAYFPWGSSGLLMPSVKYTPPILNDELSIALQYINVYGRTNYKGLGILRTKDMLQLTTQLNW